MLFEPLFTHAAQTPDSLAIIDDRGRYTFSQLGAMAAGLGMYLSFQTNQPQIGLLLPTGAGFVASFYGTLLAGKTVVPINFLLGEKEVAHIVKDSGIDVVVTIPQLAGRLKDLPLKIVDLTQLPQTPPAAIKPRFPSPAPDDVAVLLYTSGSTGLPKGVMLTYNNLQSNVDASIIHANLQRRHHFLGVIPLFHSFGITAMMLAPIQLGAMLIYLARFSPVATVNAIREHQASLIFGTPSMFGAIARLKDAKAEDFASIYAMITGAEPLPAALRQAFQSRFGVTLYEGYGMTETSPVVSLNVPQSFRPGSVGKLIPGAQIRIADEAGHAFPVGQIGEIWVKGPMVMKGYHNLPEETLNTLTADGHLKTGDLGQMDPDGFLWITGRKKELIIIAGEKAYPREIEEVLVRHPGVAEAAVMGKKDPSRGEVIVAFVSPREGQTLAADQLRDFCRDQGLAQWKCPREVIILPELPKSPTGKIIKRTLAESLTTPGA